MASRRDEYRPYTIPYTGSGGVAVGENSCISSNNPEAATSFQGLSRVQELGSTSFRTPGISSLRAAPAIASAPSSPSSGYIYNKSSWCGGDSPCDSPCESYEEHINPYSPTYIQSGCTSPASPSHLDPPFSKPSHMPLSYIGMPSGNSEGVYHMTQSEADKFNEEINEQALVAMIRSHDPPRPSADALSSAMRIRYGPGVALTPPSSCPDNASPADRKTESASTPQALDLASPRSSSQHPIRDTERSMTEFPLQGLPGQAFTKAVGGGGNETSLRIAVPLSIAPRQSLSPIKPQTGATDGLQSAEASSGTSEFQQSPNPLHNCLSSPDLITLRSRCVCGGCGNGHPTTSAIFDPSRITRESQYSPILHMGTTIDTTEADKQSGKERDQVEVSAKQGDEA